LINKNFRKNKVFFARLFGFAPLYFYILSRKDLAGGETGWRKSFCRPLVFSAREENF
jgi:hypothetical protein